MMKSLTLASSVKKWYNYELNIVNGLNPGVLVVRIVWSSGWGWFWKELLLVTDVSTTWVKVIFKVKWLWRCLDSEDEFRSGCRNISHQQQFFSELPSPGWSHYMNYWYYDLSCTCTIQNWPYKIAYHVLPWVEGQMSVQSLAWWARNINKWCLETGKRLKMF